ncbi:uncharacterized protein LOC128011751 isoform X2 [Carassius gibelio]|uniref:uncharacterized protein LOC128011751 isoform X2 n=1 Tax=Carassius gibelio TaxID=101364 RepID=UPI002278381A|nr:uncharacterized protein LOC128011751 isoform X2 [Carassius gibelio]
MPCAQSATSSSLDSSTPPQNSALRTFDPLNSTENTPVRSESSLAKSVNPVLGDSMRPHVENEAETSIIKPAEQPLKKPVPVKDITEKHIVIPVEEPLKTHADTPKTDIVQKPTEKPVEDPMKTPTDVPVENIVVKPEEESLKTHTETLVDGASTDQTQSSGSLQENTAKPLENKEDNTVEQVTIAQAPVVEAPLQPSDHGELSLVSALETPTTELTQEPSEVAPEEHNRLNSEAELNVAVAGVLLVISLHLCTTLLGKSSVRNALIKSSSSDDSSHSNLLLQLITMTTKHISESTT